jgi:hypothetical protein
MTTTITVKQVASAIEEMRKLNDFKVVLGYADIVKPVPVTTPIVAVSLKECGIGKRKIMVDDSGEEIETQWRDVTIVVGVDIYFAYARNQALGIQIFDEILRCLLLNEKFTVTEAFCEEAHYDVATQSILIPSSFTIIKTIAP